MAAVDHVVKNIFLQYVCQLRISASLLYATFTELTAPDFFCVTWTGFTSTLFTVAHNTPTVFKELPFSLWKKAPIAVDEAVVQWILWF